MIPSDRIHFYYRFGTSIAWILLLLSKSRMPCSVVCDSVRHGGRPMKSFQRIAKCFIILGLTQSGSAFGDSFFDFGLQWTQWLPTKGQVRHYEADEKATVLAVPSPSATARRSSSNQTYNPPQVEYSAPVAATPPIVQPVATPVAYQAPSVASTTSMPASYFANPAPSNTRFDALINMGSGPYPLSDQLLSGRPEAWYQSPVVQSVYGGTPSADQQRTIEQDVLQKVQQTYANNGIGLNLTTDPNAGAGRTISVVSGASYASMNDAAGITSMNSDGFSFIDKLNNVSNVNDLEWAVARNVAHELMHSFDVAHHDTTGQFLDSAVANWNMLLDPNTKFSDAAVADLKNKLAGGTDMNSSPDAIGFLGQHIVSSKTCSHCLAAQTILPQPVPEPATIAIWVVGLAVGYVANKNRQRRLSA